nr:putative retrotransposon Ty1-copia subclass protein [Tanacetum cinerariifolium]
TRHAPDQTSIYIDAEEHELGDLNEPANYKTALLDPKFDKWPNAMNVEMQSMKDNQVWDLVDLLPNGKTIGSKWLFKKKIDMDGVVHTYKTHLVAKGFTQTYEVDYEETFSHVAEIRVIRILIVIAAFYDYEIWQWMSKTAFLNGHLSKEKCGAQLVSAAYLVAFRGSVAHNRVYYGQVNNDLVQVLKHVNLPPSTSTLLAIPIGYWKDLSANLTLIFVGLRVPMESFAYKEYGIRFMLAPRSAKALQEKALLKLHGMRKLPGSPSFGASEDFPLGVNTAFVYYELVVVDKLWSSFLVGLVEHYLAEIHMKCDAQLVSATYLVAFRGSVTHNWCFAMKDLGEAAYILRIKIYRDISKRLIGLCQSAYIEKVLKRFFMKNSKHEKAEYIAALDAYKEVVWVKKFIYGLGVVPIIEEPIKIPEPLLYLMNQESLKMPDIIDDNELALVDPPKRKKRGPAKLKEKPIEPFKVEFDNKKRAIGKVYAKQQTNYAHLGRSGYRRMDVDLSKVELDEALRAEILNIAYDRMRNWILARITSPNISKNMEELFRKIDVDKKMAQGLIPKEKGADPLIVVLGPEHGGRIRTVGDGIAIVDRKLAQRDAKRDEKRDAEGDAARDAARDAEIKVESKNVER